MVMRKMGNIHLDSTLSPQVVSVNLRQIDSTAMVLVFANPFGSSENGEGVRVQQT
jgi:hypothetical protein